MARTKRSALMDSRNKRMALAPGKRHMECLQTGAYLLYHRPQNGASGNWLARWVVPETRKQVQKRLGAADDLLEANGLTTLSYTQAQARAQAWFAACAQGAATGSVGGGHSLEALTVAEALRGYLLDKKREGMKGHKITEQTVNAHIIPALGDLLVVKLTASKLRDWHQTLAETPRRKTGRVREVVAYLEGPSSEEAMRSRRNTANRILAVLKAALNWALRDVGEGLPRPWRLVSPFKGVDSPRTRFLNASEQLRLLGGCEGDFRQLVQAALFTGARYGELTRLRVEDFNPGAGQVFIQFSKSGRPRHIKLTAGAVAWFKLVTAGRQPQDLLLQRSVVHRRTRKDVVAERGWASYDQIYFMARACKQAGISPITFHELRHTYASFLVNEGVPLSFVAQQLGHSTTEMVEQYYGHLCPDAMAAAINRLPDQQELLGPEVTRESLQPAG